nr:transposase [uncultured Novosphingobium sp.]
MDGAESMAAFTPSVRMGGRRRGTDMRVEANALMYLASAGCAWRLLPKCLPRWSRHFGHFRPRPRPR